jgi:hypothetical protein
MIILSRICSLTCVLLGLNKRHLRSLIAF